MAMGVASPTPTHLKNSHHQSFVLNSAGNPSVRTRSPYYCAFWQHHFPHFGIQKKHVAHQPADVEFAKPVKKYRSMTGNAEKMPLVKPRRAFLFMYLLLGMTIATYLQSYALSYFNIVKQNSKWDQYPEQVHISLAGPNYMRISWMAANMAANMLPLVEYGTISGSYSSVSWGKRTKYIFLSYKSKMIFDVIIGPLQPDTHYYYRCGKLSKEFKLKTPPSNLAGHITFAVVGDLGQTHWSVATLNHIQKYSYDVLLYAGDLSYADYYQPRWDSFGRLVAPAASGRPWMVTEGNHEIEKIPLVTEPFRAYNARWKMPYEQSGSHSNLYYSFNVASAHVLMLGSYVDYGERSEQFKWLKEDLAKVDRTRTPWLIVVLHAPWYNSNYDHQGDGEGMMQSMETLLYKHKVDILMAGHVHAYERWDRMYKDRYNPCGMVHITIGDGGNREGLAKHFIVPKPKWSHFREASFGYGKLRLVNFSHAHWAWQRNEDSEGKSADETWIHSLSDASNLCHYVGGKVGAI